MRNSAAGFLRLLNEAGLPIPAPRPAPSLCSTDAGFTLRTYTHVTTKMQEQAADTMGQFIAQNM